MKKIILLISFIVSIGCNDNSEMRIVETVKYDEESILKFEDIISNYEIIPIKLNKQLLLNEDVELSYRDNYFYLIDYNVNNRIVVLNNMGEFQNFIGAKGNGNGEYLNLRDYYINNDTISIFSNLSREEYRYLKSGAFIGKTKININFMQVLPFSNERSFYYIGYDAVDEDSRVVELCSGREENKFLKHSAKILSFTECQPALISHDEGIIVRETISNSLYFIDKNNITSILCNFDFGEYNIPKDYYTKSDAMVAAMELTSKKYASAGRLLVNDNYMIQQVDFNSIDNHSFAYGVKDMNNNKWYWVNYNSNDSSPFVNGPKLIDNQNNIYFVVNKEDLYKLDSKSDLYVNSEVTDLFILKCKLKL